MARPDDYVLMVEDNEDDITLTLRSFEKQQFPYRIVVLRDGDAALQHLRAAAGDASRLPVLVLLDLNLPKIRGMDVLREIRLDPRLVKLPVIILSSSVEHRDRAEAAELRVDRYIRKPIDLHDFGAVAREIQQFLDDRNPPIIPKT